MVGRRRRSGDRSRTSSSQELKNDGGKLSVVLEDSAVTAVGVYDEFGSGDAAVQVFGQLAGDHAVVVAVGDKGGCGDARKVAGGAVSPAFDGLQLCLEGFDGDLFVAVYGALVEAFNERAACALAGLVPVEEEVLLGIFKREGGAQRV